MWQYQFVLPVIVIYPIIYSSFHKLEYSTRVCMGMHKNGRISKFSNWLSYESVV
jgi:hypothetical protein